MKNRKMIGFLGAGNMAGAIINGIVSAGCAKNEDLRVFDVLPDKLAAFSEKGIMSSSSASELVSCCDIIFLAVKPQNFEELLVSISPFVTTDKLFVTIAAGISTAYIRKTLSCACPVVRAMPNTPLLLSEGATALCRSDGVSDEAFEQIKGFFEACGIVSVMDESLLNPVIAVNGSSPAYIYLFAKAVVSYAKSEKIDPDEALRLFAQTLKGSADMLLKSGNSPDELIRLVSSPGGTTLKALDVFYERGFEDTVADAMRACTKRAFELGK